MRILIALVLIVSLAVNGVLAYFSWHRAAPPSQPPRAVGGPVVIQTQGGMLEVSTVTNHERFESTTNHTILGVPVGTTVAMIQVPAVYRYRIPLAKEWTVRNEGGTLIAVAPVVQPALPVAVDLSKLQSFSSGTWAPITAPSLLAALQKSITPELEKKAVTAAMVQLQREAARQTVTEFVNKWVVEQPKWKIGKAPAVLVFFEDEPLGKQIGPLLRESAR